MVGSNYNLLFGTRLVIVLIIELEFVERFHHTEKGCRLVGGVRREYEWSLNTRW